MASILGKKQVKAYLSTVSKVIETFDQDAILNMADRILQVYNAGGTIFTFGNGGSGATASHVCGDILKGLSYGLDKRFKAICLNDNTPGMMAIANDIAYEEIFVELIKNFIQPKDMAIGFSGSGNSINVLKAIEYANQIGATTVAFCGYNGGKVKSMVDLALHANIDDMEMSEDVHLVLAHSIKQIVMKRLGLQI